ncbi:unnamed protein product [Rotaria magnacalcarata]|uniref:Uncharacterized protein n=3 Tax=Rotaria magnacalcarata TaxID=392030 RepID=A0A820FJJ1_9BILA|nr:unnamed protein product [Rotaria magnacalcarata]
MSLFVYYKIDPSTNIIQLFQLWKSSMDLVLTSWCRPWYAYYSSISETPSMDDIVQVMQSNESDNIQKSIEEYLILLQNRINQQHNILKDFVHLHHIDLVKTVNYQKHKLKDIIYEKPLFNQVSSYHLMKYNINQSINQITTMCKKQLKILEDFTVFELRILCHTLPKTFNDIPIAIYQNLFGNGSNKIMQELKR